ncbi:lipoprotein amino terminal region domain-containing protein [Ditylenchus destructor]|nr:lipoprotein amino terminal region domain-containing protein [Ditylenchus destructor]
MFHKPRRWLGPLLVVVCLSYALAGYSTQASVFEVNREYSFKYASQISTGLSLNHKDADNSQGGQRAITSLRANVHLKLKPDPTSNEANSFVAILKISRPQIGTLNQRLPNTFSDRAVLPWALFSQNDIDSSLWHELHMPMQFRYSQGEVSALRFNAKDGEMSKNIKRAAVNFFQLNLARQQDGMQDSSGEYRYEQSNGQNSDYDVFSLPEHMNEGICHTTYTVSKSEGQLDVKKTVDYGRCDLLNDNVFGFESSHSSRQCALCSMEAGPYVSGLSDDQYDPCMRICGYGQFDGVERATTIRYTLSGTADEYGIERAETFSTYRFISPETSFGDAAESASRTPNNKSSGSIDSFLHSTAISRLIFRGSDPLEEESQSSFADETEALIHDNGESIREKRHYMYGDKEIRSSSTIRGMQNKVQQAVDKLSHVIKETTFDKVSSNAATHLQDLVEVLRKCNESEIQSIYTVAMDRYQSNIRTEKESVQNSPAFATQREKSQEILDDCLASAGTRNALAILVQRMKNGNVSPMKAVTTLKLFSGALHSPSDEQVLIMLDLCQSKNVAMNNEISRGTCWLTVGALIGKVCQPMPRSVRIALGNGQKVCSSAARQQYKEAFVRNLDLAKNIHDKILALKAIGNAGLTETATILESIIKSTYVTTNGADALVIKSHIIRVAAIDALRRFHVRAPELVRKIVFPVFLNITESEEVRIAAFWQLMTAAGRMESKPWLLEEIGTVLKEQKHNSPQLFSFVYRTLQKMAELNEPSLQATVKQIKTLLSSIDVGSNELASSFFYSIPLADGSLNTLNLAAVFPRESSMFPSQAGFGLGLLPFANPTQNPFLTGHALSNQIQLGVSLHGVNGWFEKVVSEMSAASDNVTSSSKGSSQWHNYSLRELRKLMSKIRATKRNVQNSPDFSPLALLTARLGEMDEFVMPLVDSNRFGLPSSIYELIMSSARKENDKYRFRFNTMGTIGEKWAHIPTTTGMPIKVIHSLPLMTSQELRLDNDGYHMHARLQTAFSASHLHRMEVVIPKMTAIGSESLQSLESTLPLIDIDIDYRRRVQDDAVGDDNLQVVIAVPAEPSPKKTTLFAMHCLPVTYTREWNPRTQAHGSVNIKTVHFSELESQQRTVNMVDMGKEWGMPISMKGHIHMPTKQQIGKFYDMVRLFSATENHIKVILEPQSKTSNSASEEEKQRRQIQLKFNVRGHAFRQKSREAIAHTCAKLSDSFYDNWSQLATEQTESGRNLRSELDNEFERIKERNKVFEQVVESKFEVSRVRTSRLLGQKSREKTGYFGESSIKLECDMDTNNYCRVSLKAQSKCNAGQSLKLSLKAFYVSPEEFESIEELIAARAVRNKFLNLVSMVEAKLKLTTDENMASAENAKNEGKSPVQAQWGGRIRLHGESSQLSSLNETSEITRPVVINKMSVKLDQMDSTSMFFLMEGLRDYYRAHKDGMLAEDKFDVDYAPKLDINEAEILLVVDPFSQRHADFVIYAAATPMTMQARTTQFSSIHWPEQLDLVELVSGHNNSDTEIPQAETGPTSISNFLRQLGVNARPFCWVDGSDLRSFNEVIYRSPLSTCYTVLAADCADVSAEDKETVASSEDKIKPKFVVMMKRVGPAKENSRHNLKLITDQWTIEAERASTHEPGQKTPLDVTLNGMRVDSDVTEQPFSLEFMDSGKTQMRIHTPDVDLIFDGKRLWIRVAGEHQNSICGLCAHNGLGLKKKHRELTNDNQECDGEDLDSFYSNAEFGAKEQKRTDEHAHAIMRKDEEDHEAASVGHIDTVELVPKTKAKEYGHQICFTLSPVPSCPEHSITFIEIVIDLNSPKKVSENDSIKKVNAQFGCMDRSEPDVVRLLKDIRDDNIASEEKQWMTDRLAQLSPSFNEDVIIPNACFRFDRD